MSTTPKPAHRIVRRAFRGLGLEERAQRMHEHYRVLRGGPTVWRNHRDDERVRLVAAAALREDSNCIDVGANEGVLLQHFAELAPRGRHIAYEPVPALAEALERRFPSVEVRRAAASDSAGETSFVVHKELASRSSMRSVGYPSDVTETLTVRTEDIDSSLPDGYVPHLLKVDVEGAEHLVLRGALRTLATHRPLVLFEHQKSTASHYGSGPEEMFDLLTGDAGMRIFDMDGSGPYTLERFGEAYETGSRWNFVAVPSP
jgi:FkbM family methyltransferase